MTSYKNRNSVYELVDVIREENLKQCKCAICKYPIARGSFKLLATYSQVGGILLQKKSMHQYHSVPNIYISGYKTFKNI